MTEANNYFVTLLLGWTNLGDAAMLRRNTTGFAKIKETIRYKKPGSRRWRKMTLDVIEFMRRFLQHILPTGFMKIRYYGFMSPGASVTLDRIRAHIELAFGFDVEPPEFEPQPMPKPTCPDCG